MEQRKLLTLSAGQVFLRVAEWRETIAKEAGL
jgi:hypothetical protein